jgi:hypothetical protein
LWFLRTRLVPEVEKGLELRERPMRGEGVGVRCPGCKQVKITMHNPTLPPLTWLVRPLFLCIASLVYYFTIYLLGFLLRTTVENIIFRGKQSHFQTSFLAPLQESLWTRL